MIEFRNGEIATVEEATYISADFSLVYRQRPPIKEHRPKLADHIEEILMISCRENYLVLADTLTIVFSRQTRELVSFDAYTNCNLWERAAGDIILPELSGSGGIYLFDSLLSGRLDLCVKPTYTYYDTRSLLKIALNHNPESKYYRISSQLIVGLNHTGLASLLMQGLVMK